ncbi:MAG: two-component system, NarL family, sensor histidine kinase BarA [Clostridia bacterium]|nr:two-component system, NarL family, sensor histidine kinase BarA [Clostridia bacterium]
MLGKSLTSRFMIGTTVAIILIMTVNFIWDYHEQKRQALIELREKAQVITKQLQATREFIARNQDRINYDSEGNFEFKYLNPAAVGRGVGDIFGMWTDYSIKQTRINYRNPHNAPDQFEIKALQKFAAEPDLQEIWAEDNIDGKKVFRYIIPLKVKESCLPCHGQPKGEIDVAGYHKEGYKVGDLAGVVSLIMPMDIFIANLKSNFLRHMGFILLLVAASISSIYFLVTKLVIRPLGDLQYAVAQVGSGKLDINLDHIKAEGEIKQLANHFQEMANQLRDLYNNLEQKVDERTAELTRANQILKEKQEELERTNLQLKEANRYKSEFLAAMSHELRTPLTSIIAFTELLLIDLPEEREVERQNLEEICKNGQNLLTLINNLLDLAKIEAGRHDLKLETVDMADVLGSVEGVITPLAIQKGLDFEVNCCPRVPLIKVDPEKIRRAIENLAGNAVKFTEPGGKVRISVDFDSEKGEILISVSDTGIGIKKEEQQIIFEKFTQLDGSNSRKYRGTGLGLALTKELVELHGGWIKVDSEVGKGSIFTIGLPVSRDFLDGGEIVG